MCSLQVTYKEQGSEIRGEGIGAMGVRPQCFFLARTVVFLYASLGSVTPGNERDF